MKLTDLNRHGEIGANSMFVQIGSFNILIDAGLNPKQLGYDALPDFETIENIDLDLIVLTHCHLDHLGSMPIVATHNPKTPIITTAPNATLAPRMLRNSINVMKRTASPSYRSSCTAMSHNLPNSSPSNVSSAARSTPRAPTGSKSSSTPQVT
jgi:predicted metal-dependent RNase